jgi:hypothetical protein
MRLRHTLLFESFILPCDTVRRDSTLGMSVGEHSHAGKGECGAVCGSQMVRLGCRCLDLDRTASSHTCSGEFVPNEEIEACCVVWLYFTFCSPGVAMISIRSAFSAAL